MHYYLVAFNVASALGWSLVLVRTVVGIVVGVGAVDHRHVQASASWLVRLVPPTYAYTWSVLAPVQSLAALEVLHVLLRLVKSPLPTTLIQVSSRLILVWAVLARIPSTHSNPIYTTMVLAWSLTEVPRYSYYALGLLRVRPPSWLTWLRYSAFYILYPLGAGSEALLTLSTISHSHWTLEDWLKAAMVVIWIPGLYIMYTHMIRTRRKVLGSHKKKD